MHGQGVGFECVVPQRPNHQALSPRPHVRANGGERLRDLLRHRQLHLYQLPHIHVLQATLC